MNPMERCLVLVTDIADAINDLMAKPVEKVIGALGYDFDTPWKPTVEDDQGEALEPEPLTWEGWAVPAILEVLAENPPLDDDELGWTEWREHVAPLIAERIACDPQRAIEALRNEKVNP